MTYDQGFQVLLSKIEQSQNMALKGKKNRATIRKKSRSKSSK
jgi:hypothetical protein